MSKTRRRIRRRITVTVEGSPVDRGHVRLQDFINKLTVVRSALQQTERQITGDDPTTYWRVVNLSHHSPAKVTLEEVFVPQEGEPLDPPAHVVDEFIRNLSAISKRAKLPEEEPRDLSVLESYLDLATVSENNVSRLMLQSGNKKVEISQKFKNNVQRIIGPDELLAGSVNGVLEAINIHNTFKFNIYPIVGPTKVACTFKLELKAAVIAAIGKYVNVAGTLRYKHWAQFPHAIDADEIEVYPDDSSLPTLSDLRGIAPNATGDLKSHEFIESLRDADW
jgi:hypothetical protein